MQQTGSQSSSLHKLIATFLAISSVFWLGGSVVRMALGYSIFVPGTLQELVPMSDPERLRVIRLFTDIGAYVWGSFAVAVFMSLILLFMRGKTIKSRGWEFMSYILFFVSVPFEVYQIMYDWRLYQYFNYSTGALSVAPLVNPFQERFAKTSGFSTGTFFAYITIIVLLVWKPLDRTSKT